MTLLVQIFCSYLMPINVGTFPLLFLFLFSSNERLAGTFDRCKHATSSLEEGLKIVLSKANLN